MGRGNRFQQLNTKEVLFKTRLPQEPERQSKIFKKFVQEYSQDKKDFTQAFQALSETLGYININPKIHSEVAESTKDPSWEFQLKEASSRIEYFIEQDKYSEYKPEDLQQLQSLYENHLFTGSFGALGQKIRPLFWKNEGEVIRKNNTIQFAEKKYLADKTSIFLSAFNFPGGEYQPIQIDSYLNSAQGLKQPIEKSSLIDNLHWHGLIEYSQQDLSFQELDSFKDVIIFTPELNAILKYAW